MNLQTTIKEYKLEEVKKRAKRSGERSAAILAG